MKRNVLVSLVFIIIILSGCNNKKDMPIITLSGTVDVILDGEQYEKIAVVIYKDNSFLDSSIIGKVEYMDYITSGQNYWQVGLTAFPSPADVYITTRVFLPETEVWFSLHTYNKILKLENVHKNDISNINLGQINYNSISGYIDTVNVDGKIIPHNDMTLLVYRSSDGQWDQRNYRIFNNGDWHYLFEPFNQPEDIILKLRFHKEGRIYTDFSFDIGRKINVFNSKISGINLGNIAITTREIHGTISDNYTLGIAALASNVNSNDLDNNLWQIHWLGQTAAEEFTGSSWTINVPSVSYRYLWFMIRDIDDVRFITTEPLDTTIAVNLDVSKMIRLK